MMRMTLMTVMCAMAMLAVAAQSRAEVLITNLTGDYSTFGTSLNGTGASYSAGNRKAGGFRMGDNSFLLDSVELRLKYMENEDIPVVSLFDNGVGDEPGNLLVTLNNPAFNYGVSDTYAFTPAVPFELMENTDYWIVVNNDTTADASFWWEQPEDGLYPVGPMATATSYLYANDSTVPWILSGIFSAYAVNGIIPEPTTLSLLAVGLLSLSCGRGPRNSKKTLNGNQ